MARRAVTDNAPNLQQEITKACQAHPRFRKAYDAALWYIERVEDLNAVTVRVGTTAMRVYKQAATGSAPAITLVLLINKNGDVEVRGAR
ncbi:MAG: hypothetical protein HQL38_05780 [Alphaproteobacteria bacterium]|nr:hypothetical protein [Alphaproteobacteria bacterium]MBF0333347.1 hypothetical protein [Alphaproteobacteria bacterium]MBF0392172.1 hypothetical protein [Alphaproteobacteria bacterium]